MRLRQNFGFLLGLCFLVVGSISKPAPAQQTQPRLEMKDPEVAKNYAYYFTGLGYFYTGEYVRGVGALAITLFAANKALDQFGCNSSLQGLGGGCSKGKEVMWIAVAIAPYVYGILDAEKSAKRVNTRLKATHALIDVDREGHVLVGLHTTFR
jgi:hypothetical protein